MILVGLCGLSWGIDLSNDLTKAILLKQIVITTTRHKALSENVINMYTPGYERVDVDDYASQFDDYIDSGDVAGIESLEIRKVMKGGPVDMEQELLLVKKNALKNALFTEVLKQHYASLMMAISGN